MYSEGPLIPTTTVQGMDTPIQSIDTINRDPQAISLSSERQEPSAFVFEDVEPNKHVGDLVEDEEQIQALVYTAQSPANDAVPILLPPVDTQQPSWDGIRKEQEELLNSLNQILTKIKRDVVGLEGRIDSRTMTLTALRGEMGNLDSRMNLVDNFILQGPQERVLTENAIRRRNALDQVQAELAVRAGFIGKRTHSSSADAMAWRLGLTEGGAINTDEGRLAFAIRLLETVAENDESLKRLIESPAMALLTTTDSDTVPHQVPLNSINEALNNTGENKDALAAIRSFLNLPENYYGHLPSVTIGN